MSLHGTKSGMPVLAWIPLSSTLPFSCYCFLPLKVKKPQQGEGLRIQTDIALLTYPIIFQALQPDTCSLLARLPGGNPKVLQPMLAGKTWVRCPILILGFKG